MHIYIYIYIVCSTVSYSALVFDLYIAVRCLYTVSVCQLSWCYKKRYCIISAVCKHVRLATV
jgi:hypothetical protein